MTQLIHDILPPQTVHFYRRNSGKIRIAALLVFLLTSIALLAGPYTNIVRKEVKPALSTLLLTGFFGFAILKLLTPPALTFVGAGFSLF